MRDDSRSVVDRVEAAVLDSLRTAGACGCSEPVVLAVSGGADSLCLLYALLRTALEHRCVLHVAHLDHMLRGIESREDARFVAAQADALGLACTVEAKDVLGQQQAAHCSLEEAARDVRYAFLREVAVNTGASLVLTGHTRDDAVETVMLHILRGSGIHGLRGLELVARYPDRAGGAEAPGLRLIRPLIGVSRGDAACYCRALRLTPREDPSNESTVYLRNRVRLELLPSMRRLNPRVDDALLRLAAAAAADDDALSAAAQEWWQRCAGVWRDRVQLDAASFAVAPAAVQARVVFRVVAQLQGSSRDVTAEHVTAVRDIAAGSEGRQLDLPGGLVWRRAPGCVTAFLRDAVPCREPMPESPLPLDVPGEVGVPRGRVTARLVSLDEYLEEGPCVAFLDVDLCGRRLFVRRRRPGDRFRPLGLGGEKKLQDFMVDAHVPAEERDSVPVVCNESHVVWLAGLRLDDRVRVTPASRLLLRLDYVQPD